MKEARSVVKLRLPLVVCAILALGAFTGSATADPHAGPPICSSAGKALFGKYGSLTVWGNAYVPKGHTLTVRGQLKIANGACLDAFTLGTVHVGGNLLVGNGAILALGCTPDSIGPVPPCGTHTTNDTVGGNLTGYKPLTMYLDGDHIAGNLTSEGGGPGLRGAFLNFPIKDNTVGGNLTLYGWHGGWSGVIRNVVGGSVVYSKNMSIQDPDSNEVVTNTIGGNLTCRGNSPAVQVGDSGGSPNVVGGHRVGQCTAAGL
jgi:hypothetical protein